MSAKNYGLMAEYHSAAEIYHACEQVRDAGYSKWDACTPFPVHGLDKAMGLKASILPWFVLAGGLTGGIGGLLTMLWMSAMDYTMNIGGKPFASVPAFIPITFELTILFSGLTTFFGLWLICRLPRLYHSAFNNKSFERVTNDRFFIVIESADPHFDSATTRSLLEASGAAQVEEVEA